MNFNRKNAGRTSLILVLVVALIGALIGSAITNLYLAGERGSNEAARDNNGHYTINVKDTDNVATAVAKKAMPSVVGITTQGVQNSLFGAVQVQGTGSGIIVDKSGYILTNAHVVKIQNQIVDKCTVALDNDETVVGRPVWVDTSIDVAMVKIDAKNLVPAELGDSDKIQIGDTAIAIGNPINMAYQRSVTQGIISGLDRYVGAVSGGGYMTGLIQTDASINGGNSGGPLLNDRGEVIGINTVKVQTAEGLGFSIPINSVKNVIDQIVKTGDFKVVSLGVQTANVESVKRAYDKKIDLKEGAFVVKVYDNSPAQKAGIMPGDIITKINGKRIQDNEVLKSSLYNYKIDDTTKVELYRNNKKLEVEIKFTNYSVADDKNAQKDEMQKQEELRRQQEELRRQQENNSQYESFIRDFFRN